MVVSFPLLVATTGKISFLFLSTEDLRPKHGEKKVRVPEVSLK